MTRPTLQVAPVMASFPTDPLAAMRLVLEAHNAAQAAFLGLLAAPQENALKLQAHQTYREKAVRLLELLRGHNASGLAPSPWDLTTVAQPLVQQTLIEADITDAVGKTAEATSLREYAVAVAKRELPPLAVARVRRSLAGQLAIEGRFNEALTELHDVRQLFVDAGDVVQSAQTMLEESVLLEWLGDDERALDSITQARSAVVSRTGTELPITSGVAEALVRESEAINTGIGPTGEADRAAALWRVSVEIVEHEARVRQARGEYDAAAALFSRVLTHYESIGAGASIEYQLASIDRSRGRYQEAQTRLERIEPAFTDGLLSGKIAGLRQMQSYVALGLGDPTRALGLANQGVAELTAHPDEDLAWRLRWREAQALRALGRPKEALAAFGSAVDSVDALRKAPLGYRLDSTALRKKLPVIEEAITFAAEQGDAPACLRFIELVKARALSSALSVPAPERTGRTELEAQFDRITQRLDALEYHAMAQPADAVEVWKERASLLKQRIVLMEQLRLRDPRWRGLTVPPPFDAALLATNLKARGHAALSLYVHDGVVRSVLVADGRFEVGHSNLESDVASILEDYTANLVRPKPDPYSLDPADLGLGAALFVPPELLRKALGAKSLLIAPHGQLHLLPWPALLHDDARLFEHTPIGVVPNLTCVLALDFKPAKSPRVAIAGLSTYAGLANVEELPGSGLELGALKALYKGRYVAPPLEDSDATEEAVRALAMRDDSTGAILHIACHGTLSVEDPLRSAVLVQDGKIDAAEWAQMRLHYDEVVLSACSTGWRPLIAQGVALHGDDILGLPGALLEAGARSVVVSIPKAIDKATAAFMSAYHGRRAQGISPLVAFCETQREMLSSQFEPYTWSGLVLYGVS